MPNEDKPAETSTSSAKTRPRITVGRVIKWTLCLLVLFFVGREAKKLWTADDVSTLSLDVRWLLPAAMCYLVGWLPSVWFWRRMMFELGASPGFAESNRAYFCGHLGKYVPGKALSLVIRSSMLKSSGTSVPVSAISATLETLGVMGVGLAVWLALAPVTLPDELWLSFPGWLQQLREPWWMAPVIVAAGVAVAVPLSSKLLSLVAGKLNPDGVRGDSGREARRVSPRVVLAGSAAFLATWALHGLSIGLTLRGIGVEPSAWQLSDWPLWSCAVAGATSVGFFALFAPGGLGIREGLLIATLQTSVGGRAAVAVAAVYRLVCFVSELIAAGLLFAIGPRKSDSSEES
ncbi:MAG: flippase-like domain-containing protein [Planctomycetes bacterium]|nr:flippase-like domain-containing protein [Planctomycetota bacterium]